LSLELRANIGEIYKKYSKRLLSAKGFPFPREWRS